MKISYLLLALLIIILPSCTSDTETIRKELNAGIKENSKSHFNKAITHYKNVLEIDSTNAEAYLLIGDSYFNLRKWDKSMQMINKAIILDPNYGQAYKSRATIHKLKNNRDAACKDFLKAQELGVENLHNDTKFCK